MVQVQDLLFGGCEPVARGPAMMPASGVECISDGLQPTSVGGFQMTGRGWDEVHEHIVQPAHHDEARRSDRRIYLQVKVTFSEAIEMPVLVAGGTDFEHKRRIVHSLGLTSEDLPGAQSEANQVSLNSRAAPVYSILERLRYRHRHRDHTSISPSPQPTIETPLPRYHIRSPP
jgi:hypothetical protein